ncbi:MAG: hypothetical protein AAGJ35_15250, partial [Myxococcota bacterium]
LGMMMAVKAMEGVANKPSWYEEVKAWADQSASAFLKHNTKVKSNRRLVKLGSCWGGFGSE